MFKDKLYNISKDLCAHHRLKDEVMSGAVKERLDSSLTSYIDSINKSYDYLRHRGEIRVLDKINRGRKKDDKSIR